MGLAAVKYKINPVAEGVALIIVLVFHAHLCISSLNA